MTTEASAYALTWLYAAAAAVTIWIAAAYIWRRRHQYAPDRPALSALAAIYFVVAGGLYLRGMVSLWRQWALPQTPLLLLAAIISLLAVYGGSRGVRPVLRLCLPVFITVSLLLLLDTGLLIPEMSWERLGLTYAEFDMPAFLRLLGAMLLPLPAALLLPEGDPRRLRPFFWGGSLIGLAYLLLSAMRAVLLLGPLTVLEPYPLLRALMLVYVGPGLGRMEAWGLMALSGAMVASAMAMAAGALKRVPDNRRKLGAGVVAVVLTIMVIF